MRVAVVGSGGAGLRLVTDFCKSYNEVVILTRTAKANLKGLRAEFHIADYSIEDRKQSLNIRAIILTNPPSSLLWLAWIRFISISYPRPKPTILYLFRIDTPLIFVEDQRSSLNAPTWLAGFIFLVDEGRVQHLAKVVSISAVELLKDERFIWSLRMLVISPMAGIMPHRKIGRYNAISQHDVNADQISWCLRPDISDGQRIFVYSMERAPDLLMSEGQQVRWSKCI